MIIQVVFGTQEGEGGPSPPILTVQKVDKTAQPIKTWSYFQQRRQKTLFYVYGNGVVPL